MYQYIGFFASIRRAAYFSTLEDSVSLKQWQRGLTDPLHDHTQLPRFPHLLLLPSGVQLLTVRRKSG
jgi:hypothetical protein